MICLKQPTYFLFVSLKSQDGHSTQAVNITIGIDTAMFHGETFIVINSTNIVIDVMIKLLLHATTINHHHNDQGQGHYEDNHHQGRGGRGGHGGHRLAPPPPPSRHGSGRRGRQEVFHILKNPFFHITISQFEILFNSLECCCPR